jgi:hypothetical protein
MTPPLRSCWPLRRTGTPGRYRPRLEALECRLTPAVSAAPAPALPLTFDAAAHAQAATADAGSVSDDIVPFGNAGPGGPAASLVAPQGAALAAGTFVATGQQFAVVADPTLNQVLLYGRIPGTNQLGTPIPITGSDELPLLGPDAVQTFTVAGDPNPYLVGPTAWATTSWCTTTTRPPAGSASWEATRSATTPRPSPSPT